MKVTAKRTDRSLALYLSGELDHHAAKEAMAEIDRHLDVALPLRTELNLSELSFMDSSGIGILLNRYKQMAGSGGTVTIYGVNAQVGRVLAIGGIGRLMKYFDTKEAAIAG